MSHFDHVYSLRSPVNNFTHDFNKTESKPFGERGSEAELHDCIEDETVHSDCFSTDLNHTSSSNMC